MLPEICPCEERKFFEKVVNGSRFDYSTMECITDLPYYFYTNVFQAAIFEMASGRFGINQSPIYVDC
jgi:hypothetical protein